MVPAPIHSDDIFYIAILSILSLVLQIILNGSRSTRPMLDPKEFDALRGEMESYDAAREEIIKRSRDITKHSKAAIYALHRDEDAEAQAHLQDAQRAIAELLPRIAQDPTLRTGGFSAGIEEYVEASAFLHFLQEGSLLGRSAIQVSTAEEYLGGLSDLTGELMRYAVNRATKRDKTSVQKIRDLVDAIYGQLVQFDFRNSDLRRKYDAVKYNLQKVENVLYDLELRAA